MATPSGYRTFTSGEVLTAENVMNFLMDQSVLVFASSAAGGSALPSPAEGQFRFLKDTDAFEYYTGSAWVAAGGGDAGGFEQTFLLMGA
jgi:hypothetical protein